MWSVYFCFPRPLTSLDHMIYIGAFIDIFKDILILALHFSFQFSPESRMTIRNRWYFRIKGLITTLPLTCCKIRNISKYFNAPNYSLLLHAVGFKSVMQWGREGEISQFLSGGISLKSKDNSLYQRIELIEAVCCSAITHKSYMICSD